VPGGSLGDRATRGISAELDLSEPPGGPLGAKAAQSSAATTAELILELASACSAFDGVPGLRPGAIRCGPMNATSGAALVAAPSYRPDDKADTSARWRAWVWTLIWSLITPVSCVSCVSWWSFLNAAETHETFHWASGMRYQFRPFEARSELRSGFFVGPSAPVSSLLKGLCRDEDQVVELLHRRAML
jgi:hypothetical protein